MSKEFTEERIKDAIANVIDNFKYPKPTVADIVGYDCRIRIWDHAEYSNEILARKASEKDFYQHWIKGRLYFVKTSECERYNFKPNPKDDAQPINKEQNFRTARNYIRHEQPKNRTDICPTNFHKVFH